MEWFLDLKDSIDIKLTIAQSAKINKRKEDSSEEVSELLDAWDDAVDGNIIALSSLMQWLNGFQGFLASCIKARSDLED